MPVGLRGSSRKKVLGCKVGNTRSASMKSSGMHPGVWALNLIFSIQLAFWQGSTCPKLRCGLLLRHPSKACWQTPWTFAMDRCSGPFDPMNIRFWCVGPNRWPFWYNENAQCGGANLCIHAGIKKFFGRHIMFCDSVAWSSWCSTFRCRSRNITWWRHRSCSTGHCAFTRQF